MIMVRCSLAPSASGGLGVFTEVDIRKGELVWLFDPRYDSCYFRDDRAGMPARFREMLDSYGFDHPTDPEMIVLDCDEGRFIAPSPSPNLDMSNPVRGVAAYAIAAGEELTRRWRSPDGLRETAPVTGRREMLAAAQ